MNSLRSAMRYSMKRCGIRIYISQLVLLSALSAGWWGILYPDLSFSEQTFAVAQEEQNAERQPAADIADNQEEKKELTGSEAFWALLGAQPEEIGIRSRLLDQILKDSVTRGKKDEQQCAHRDF